MLNARAIFYIIGWLMAGLGVAMVVPVMLSFVYGDTDWVSFLVSATLTLFIGGNLILLNRGFDHTLSHRDGFVVTTLAWVVLGAFAALPMYISPDGAPTFIDAFFEAISALTTTGSTVLVGLDHMDHGILFWRALLEWLGGMGLVVLAIAVLPFLRVGGLQIYKSEMAGVVKDKLQPRIQETTKLLWIVYASLTVFGIVIMRFAGMNWFDAVCHGFSAISTGGLSNYDDSFAHYHSALIEFSGIVVMLLGSMNFTLHYTAMHERSLKGYFKDQEFRVHLALMGSVILVISIALALSQKINFFHALRMAAFNVVSLETSTGFVSADYAHWYVLAPMLMLIVMLIGGCSGSTSGGLKVLRLIVIVKQIFREIYLLIHPHGVAHVKVLGKTVPDRVIQSVWSFAGVYFISYSIISVGLAMMGVDLVTAFSATAATLANAGPGLGLVGPASTFAGLPQAGKLLLCLSMLLGRFEVFTVLVLASPRFWRR